MRQHVRASPLEAALLMAALHSGMQEAASGISTRTGAQYTARSDQSSSNVA